MPPIPDHPLRYKLANELHARPFPLITAPGRAVFLAIKPLVDAASRDRSLDLDHLKALLDRYGAAHPQPGATHYTGEIGQHTLKWEQHTEFVTYSVFMEGETDRPFDPADFDVFPSEWLHEAPGVRVTSAMIRIVEETDEDRIASALNDWFVPESLAVSRIVDGDAIVAGDFRVDPAGHQRFAAFVQPDVGQRRIGRIAQRLCEIETYKAMSMLGFSRSREIAPHLGQIDDELSRLMAEMTSASAPAEETLSALLSVSAELESISAQTSFRFGATGAYEAIVGQRIEVLREERYGGRQTFAEFMMRRYDPAMRTVKSTEDQMTKMAQRAMRASELLRTRVEVERSAQNQAVLQSMDRRADLQLRLQETVEGLSVVAISYYAVNLLTYGLYPLASGLGIEKTWLTAGLVPLVVLGVWSMVRNIRKKMH